MWMLCFLEYRSLCNCIFKQQFCTESFQFCVSCVTILKARKLLQYFNFFFRIVIFRYPYSSFFQSRFPVISIQSSSYLLYTIQDVSILLYDLFSVFVLTDSLTSVSLYALQFLFCSLVMCQTSSQKNTIVRILSSSFLGLFTSHISYDFYQNLYIYCIHFFCDVLSCTILCNAVIVVFVLIIFLSSTISRRSTR